MRHLAAIIRSGASAGYLSLALVVGLVLLGCEIDGEPGPPALEAIDPPAAAGSGQPNLHVDDTGVIWASWIEPADTTEHALRYASFDGTEWSVPGTAAAGRDWFVNWADVPSVRTLPGGRMAAHYLVSNGPHVFAYDVRIAQTTPDSVWQEAITPHKDETETEHGFVSMLPWDGDLLAVWLDGREMSLDDDSHGHGAGAMTLRAGMLDSAGELKERYLLDDHVCECCPTSGVRTDEGVLIAYRGRTPDEIRNIGLIRFSDDGWSDPYLLHDDGWEIAGCPVNGPALAADGNRVVAAWFTAANDAPRVHAAFSDNGGRTFSDPIVIDDYRPSGQVGVTLLDDGSALISWYGREDGASALRIRHVSPDGSMRQAQTVVAPMPSVRAGIPRMVRSGEHVYFAWVDDRGAADEARVRMRRAPDRLFR